MEDVVSSILSVYTDLDTFQRMMFLWAFCFGGILLAVQICQIGEPNRLNWTRLTPEQAPFWYSFYVLEAIFFFAGSRPMVLLKIEGLLGGYEHRILNGIWLGLVGIEVMLVVGVATMSIARALRSAPKQKAQ